MYNIKSLRAILLAWTQIRLMLPAWLGSAEALRYSYIKNLEKLYMIWRETGFFFNSIW